ncbi:adenosine deaminase [Marinomonas sp. 15G1-11]|uniref:Adenine deaminase n=1 Tax=Marinomonas phaeophyticola TaxID=3004091 RepID=A0ABT4JXF1_9GAMM|nr:adenosine deaminase [Marinomonas sp. 15G1-11]MCZ2723004.1 adenosine deaminase [Marinomonas sp. 15G1-11]
MRTQTELLTLAERMPKAELHLHLEGTLEPEQMFQIAKRNNILLKYHSIEELQAAYQFSNLQDFLDLYYQGMSVLLKEEDFYDLTMAYLEKVHAQNVVHVELFFDPQGHLARGIAFDIQINGITKALTEAEQKWGMTYQLIMSFLRHLSEESAFETLDLAKPFLDKITGVGLDSSELNHPPEKFSRVFQSCKDLGLKITVHAGEEGPPDYVWQALDILNVDRIDHGNRALEDTQLTSEILRRRLTLTVCPLSNLKLCVVDSMASHPIQKMLQLNLNATVNSDDPAYFGGYMNENYRALIQESNLTEDELYRLAKNSFAGAWLSTAQKNHYLALVDDAFKAKEPT